MEMLAGSPLAMDPSARDVATDICTLSLELQSRPLAGEWPVVWTGGDDVNQYRLAFRTGGLFAASRRKEANRSGEHTAIRSGEHPANRSGEHTAIRSGEQPVIGSGEHPVAGRNPPPAPVVTQSVSWKVDWPSSEAFSGGPEKVRDALIELVTEEMRSADEAALSFAPGRGFFESDHCPLDVGGRRTLVQRFLQGFLQKLQAMPGKAGTPVLTGWLGVVQGFRMFCEAVEPGVISSPCTVRLRLLRLEADLSFQLARSIPGGAPGKDAATRTATLSLLTWLDCILEAAAPGATWDRTMLDSPDRELARAIDSHTDVLGGRLIELGGDLALARSRSLVETTEHFKVMLGRLQAYYANRYEMPRLAIAAQVLDEMQERTDRQHDAESSGPRGIARGLGRGMRVFWNEWLSLTGRASWVLLALLGLALGAPVAAVLSEAPLVIEALYSGLLVCMTIFVPLVGTWVLIYRRRSAPYVRLLPRLAGATLIGYAPLVSDNALWGALWDVDLNSALFLAFVAVSSAVGYVYISVYRRVNHRGLALARTTVISLMGLLQSALIGLILCATLGQRLAMSGLGKEFERTGTWMVLEGLPRWVSLWVPWNWDCIHFPTMVFLVWCPLAFFLGVVVQLLWEDRSIVDPV